jgi:DNA polymerase-1
MNLPKRSKLSNLVRELIEPEDGYVLLSFDVSQSELRWLAHISQDPEMCRVYQNREDIHTNTARSIVGTEWESLDSGLKKQRRKEAKSLNFGLIYGMQAPTFVKYAKQDYGITLKLDQAKEWIETFFNTYKGIRPYHHAAVRFCREHGYVTTPFGRRRLIPNINSTDFRKRSDAERQAINTPIQGVSSDAFLLAWYYLLKVPEAARLKPILFVHDDLIVEAPDDSVYLKEIIPVIKHHLVNPPIQELFGFTPIVPFEVDGSIGYSLAEMRALEE